MEKVEKVTELKARIQGSQAMFLTDFRGLTVGDVTDLRRSLRESGTRLAVVKNTLMRRAAGEAGAEELRGLLDGPTAVAFVDGDPIVAAKSLVDAMRRFRTMALKGAFMEGRVLSPEQAQSLATIEPREVLLARMAGLAQAQMSRAAFGFQALQAKFLALLEALKDKLPEPPEGQAAAVEQPGAEAGTPDEPVPEEQQEQPTQDPSGEAREGSKPDTEGQPDEGGEGKE
jgi:large subunit ribosomal protein L10